MELLNNMGPKIEPNHFGMQRFLHFEIDFLNKKVKENMHRMKHHTHAICIKVACAASNQRLCLNRAIIVRYAYDYRGHVYYPLLHWSVQAESHISFCKHPTGPVKCV